jgi:tight adherence protein B
MVLLLTFLTVALGTFAIYLFVRDLFLRDRSRAGRRLDEASRARQREQIKQSPLFRHLDNPVALAEDEDPSPNLRERFRTLVEQSALNVTPRQVLIRMIVLAVAAAVVIGLFRPVAGLVAAVLAALLPLLHVLYRRKVRLDRLLNQLPDAFDLMGRVLRAGQSVPQALQSVAEEFDQPIAGEFGYCFEQQNLGLSPEMALRDLSRRTGLLEIRILTLALLVQQETGGNLAELLDRLATVIRERIRVRGRIRALTAEGRMQAVVLLILPVALLVVLMAMSSTYFQAVVEHPWLFLAMLAMEGLGALWIRKIVNFDF